MDIEDLEPRNKKPKPRDLDSLGIDQLEEYLAELQTEAARVEEKIAAKKSYLSGVDSFFKS